MVEELRKAMIGQKSYDQKIKQPEPNRPDLDGDDVERVSLAGAVVGNIRLMSGESVPIVQPDLRGMIRFNSQDMAEKVVPETVEASQATEEPQTTSVAVERKVVQRFLETI